jgi:hypothetical protein
VPFNGLLDTAVVPVRGEITIRLAFTRPEIVGTFMYHCHVLRHEDRGMMQVIEVVDPKAVNHASNANGGMAGWLHRVLAPNRTGFEHLPICSALAAG